jgi:hypothetical protein
MAKASFGILLSITGHHADAFVLVRLGQEDGSQAKVNVAGGDGNATG